MHSRWRISWQKHRSFVTRATTSVIMETSCCFLNAAQAATFVAAQAGLAPAINQTKHTPWLRLGMDGSCAIDGLIIGTERLGVEWQLIGSLVSVESRGVFDLLISKFDMEEYADDIAHAYYRFNLKPYYFSCLIELSNYVIHGFVQTGRPT